MQRDKWTPTTSSRLCEECTKMSPIDNGETRVWNKQSRYFKHDHWLYSNSVIHCDE
ncbi:hypothetical protein ALC60_07165 [Trachymyrmex zeteki]|uniref:Uncharacterized protein n=1 Tax=Mycetomoellerius zeteki TaxID=64791 RepID=A0A151X111_9HYME|nr:hypothetical protein ALC60_07165 [Trachymyrmex zeteki]